MRWKFLNRKKCAKLRKSSWMSNLPKSDAEKTNVQIDTARKAVKNDADAIDAKMNANETANPNTNTETRIVRIMETEDSILNTVFQTAW